MTTRGRRGVEDDDHLYFIQWYVLKCGSAYFDEDGDAANELHVDRDGDKKFDEDWVDGIDNDGDGRIDEDPGGGWDEDPIGDFGGDGNLDDDFDGRVDEDGPNPVNASRGEVILYDPDLEAVKTWDLQSLLCLEHNENDGLVASLEGVRHGVLVAVPVSLMQKAGTYYFVLRVWDNHANLHKDHQVKPALEVNQIWSFKLEGVRIVVTKQKYYEEGNTSTYPREENIVVKADPNANPQYEPLYMYAVLKATITKQGTFWFLGHHNNPAHANYPKRAILDLDGDGKAEMTVPLYRWKWGNLNFSWSYIDPDWQSHNNDKNNDNQADWPYENPWTKVTPIQSGVNLWQLFNGVRVNQGLKLGTTRYKVEVTCGTQLVRSPDENDTDGYGPKETVRRVVSMYAFNTKYLRWCSTFLRVNTIYASVYKQVDRYIGGDCADVAVIAYRKMKRGDDVETSRNDGLSSHEDWWANALAIENDPELSTVNEPRAGDLVLIDINDPPDGVFDHTTIFAGSMEDAADPTNTRISPKDRMMNTNFGYSDDVVNEVPPSEYGAFAFVWATYEHFPPHYLDQTNHRIRHLGSVTEHTHP